MSFTDKLFVGEKLCYDIPVEEQKAYLTKLGLAKNDFERSFKQYKGQMFYMSVKKQLVLNFLSVFLCLVLIPYYIIIGLFLRFQKKVEIVSRVKECEQIIPETLSSKYQIDLSLWGTKGGIRPSDIGFVLFLILNYGFHPYFVLKILFKVAKYSTLIYKYRPVAILVCDEFSFTSSVMTLFCERRDVLHINVQHGEKLYDLRDSFFRFHKCYIWNKHYLQLFLALNAEPSQFEIALPPSMKFDPNDNLNMEVYADFKYYLGEYTEDEIKNIVFSMDFAKNEGKTVKFRPHPNYSDISLLKKYVPDERIEMPSVNIISSISNLKYAVGVDSTVLCQAYFNGKDVIIDDVTFKSRVEVLSSLDYILIDKVKNRLSSYQING